MLALYKDGGRLYLRPIGTQDPLRALYNFRLSRRQIWPVQKLYIHTKAVKSISNFDFKGLCATLVLCERAVLSERANKPYVNCKQHENIGKAMATN